MGYSLKARSITKPQINRQIDYKQNPTTTNVLHYFFLIPKTKEKVQLRAVTTSNYDYQSNATTIVDSIGWRTLEQKQADASLCLFFFF